MRDNTRSIARAIKEDIKRKLYTSSSVKKVFFIKKVAFEFEGTETREIVSYLVGLLGTVEYMVVVREPGSRNLDVLIVLNSVIGYNDTLVPAIDAILSTYIQAEITPICLIEITKKNYRELLPYYLPKLTNFELYHEVGSFELLDLTEDPLEDPIIKNKFNPNSLCFDNEKYNEETFINLYNWYLAVKGKTKLKNKAETLKKFKKERKKVFEFVKTNLIYQLEYIDLEKMYEKIIYENEIHI
ncbi:MAG: hypothetical protein EOP34_03760 [Rickettsiales bacterium]|nr:MAG: hypothetical protein EOP34_03760 [Rickettsiales bacterium]